MMSELLEAVVATGTVNEDDHTLLVRERLWLRSDFHSQLRDLLLGVVYYQLM